MDYKKDMQRCLAYIDNHIYEEVTPRSLAELLGYSFYHFCHVFRICNDMPVGEYLRKRRLQHAVEALAQGVKITEIAATLGFDTPSGFAKAFRREFGMSASQYRKQTVTQKLGEGKGGVFMKVRMVRKDRFKAVGYCIAPREGQKVDIVRSSAYWFGSDFSVVSPADYAELAQDNPQISLWVPGEENSGDLSYFLGPVVENFAFVPQGMVTLEIPAADYAVFTTEPADLANDKQAFYEAIQKTWQYIFTEWFAESDYLFDQEKLAFEYYTDENGDMDCREAVVDIYIPVRKKTG